jgi:hypothetical protein
MEVVRVVPNGGEDSAPLFLNHHVTVTFSLPLDPLSINADTVRILDADGLGVPGRLRIAAKSVTFEPNPPLTPSLDDGSFRPDAAYRLEVAGFPRANAVRAADGHVLEQTVVRAFRTVPRDATGLGYPSPLLPVMRGDETFRLRRELLPRVAADLGRLRVHFTLPPLPSTVTLQAFEVALVERRQPASRVSDAGQDGRTAAGDRDQAARDAALRVPVLPLRAVRVLSSPEPIDPFPGCTVELELADKGVLRGDGELLFLRLSDDPRHVVRDYLGRPPAEPPVPWVLVPVDPGMRTRLLDERFRDPAVLPRNADGRPGFVVDAERGRAVPQVRRAAGSGTLGAFRPQRSMVLRPGEPFDRGDGVLVRSDGDVFEFTSIHVPAGVTVTVAAGERVGVRLLACGGVAIAGELHVDAPPGDGYRAGERVLAEAMLLANRGLAVIAGGDLAVSGRIRQLRAAGPLDAALVLACGGEMSLEGAIPLRTVLALEPGRRARGVATDPIQVEVALAAGAVPGASVPVESWTRWYRLPADRSSSVDCIALGLHPGVQVAVQIAPQDPLRADRPYQSADVLQQPQLLPLASPLLVPAGGFVRFLLRTNVRDGTELPSLAGIAVVGV